MIPPAPPGGIAKFFYVVGLLVGFAGFALFAYPLVITIAEAFAQSQSSLGGQFNPPDFSRVGRAMPLAFGLAIPGVIVATLASAIGARVQSGANIHIGQYGDRFQGPAVKGGGRIDIGGSVVSNNTYVNTYISQIAIQELQAIDDTISRLRLPPRQKQEIKEYLQGAEQELGQRRPDLKRAGEYLATATDLMQVVGAFRTVGQELAPRLWHLASLLGTAGDGVRQLLT
jgi:hypothetical protein